MYYEDPSIALRLAAVSLDDVDATPALPCSARASLVAGMVGGAGAHDDQPPSLSIADGADGKILVRCHAGCSQAAIIEALRAKGLWPARCGGSKRARVHATHRSHAMSSGPEPSREDKREHARRLWAQTGEAAARRWVKAGRSVRIVRAPAGPDFNDVLV
jgi:hypothetical protein